MEQKPVTSTELEDYAESIETLFWHSSVAMIVALLSYYGGQTILRTLVIIACIFTVGSWILMRLARRRARIMRERGGA